MIARWGGERNPGPSIGCPTGICVELHTSSRRDPGNGRRCEKAFRSIAGFVERTRREPERTIENLSLARID